MEEPLAFVASSEPNDCAMENSRANGRVMRHLCSHCGGGAGTQALIFKKRY